jgi:ActR/RegA family two-component response regulator
MKDHISSNPVNVLIIDDDRVMVAQISDAFKRFNENRLPIPGDTPRGPRLKFEVKACYAVEDLDQFLHGLPEYSVFVIDRSFITEPGQKDYQNLHILRSLNDLHVAGLRIVWTAYPELDDAVQCMRLGAWDYLDKKSVRHEGGDTFTDVILSAVEGLRAQDLQMQRSRTNIEGQEFFVQHRADICAAYGGNYAAFGRDSNENWELEPLAFHRTLLGLYLALDKEGPKDLENVYITFVEKPGE